MNPALMIAAVLVLIAVSVGLVVYQAIREEEELPPVSDW